MNKKRALIRDLVPGSVLALLLLALAPPALALAQAEQEPTAISIGAPATATLGEVATLQARLVDSAGAPIAKARVSFVSPRSFLNADDDVVIAAGVTDDQGLASADWQIRTSGDVTVGAVFRGDEQHAASKASADLAVTGDRQLYIQEAGVRVPGLNTAPVAAAAPLWPRLSGWPIALALLIVWSLYARVAVLLLRLTRQGAPAAVAARAHATTAELWPIMGGANGEDQAGDPGPEPEANR
ncbi:MAG: Ig-like domain-containing protein [Chloroflexi bacterium]|nr:Ig-like domain-containing protein [Chloroflexota bacterium]